MKAIKIASGVAISALAAAISAQAHAEGDTEFSWNATGSMSYIFIADLENERNDVDLNEDGDFDSGDAGDGFGIELNLEFAHGPLSGQIEFFSEDENDDTDMRVQLENLKVTEGAFSFGMIDELTSTHEYTYDMGDSNDFGVLENNLSEGANSQAAFRYTMNGLKVQLEGLNGASEAGVTADETATALDTDYGVSAEYAGTADALEYVVQGQVRVSDDDQAGDDAYTFVGAGVTYTADMFEVKVGVNNYGAATKVTEVGYEVTVTPVDALSVYAKGYNFDVAEELILEYNYLFGAAYTVDVLTFTAEYELNEGEDAQADDVLFGEVAYAQGMLGATFSVEMTGVENSDVDSDPLFEAGVSYTTDSGILYAADYDLQSGDAAQNDITFSANYAF